MAIDTLAKRYASLTFGSAGRAGTREPTGSSSAFRRASAIGGYYQEGGAVTDVVGCIASSSIYIPGAARSALGACR